MRNECHLLEAAHEDRGCRLERVAFRAFPRDLDRQRDDDLRRNDRTTCEDGKALDTRSEYSRC